MANPKKNDKIVWRTTSGFCSLEFKGTVAARRGKRYYVLWTDDNGNATGGTWFKNDEEGVEVVNG